jgi:hypothetical protein
MRIKAYSWRFHQAVQRRWLGCDDTAYDLVAEVTTNGADTCQLAQIRATYAND